MSDIDWDALAQLVGPLRLPRPYIPIEPTAKQEWFLRRDELEVFFGGAVGGGKTLAILAAGLQYVDHRSYRALLLRPSLTEFYIPGGLHEVAQDWLGRTDAVFVGGPVPQWRFPSGSTLSYGYLASVDDVDRYKGGELSFIGFEEAIGFTLRQYLGMLRMLRSADDELAGVPPRVRVVSNPATSPKTMKNQPWLKQRFIDPATRPEGVVYVPSSLRDNPHVDYDSYVSRLAHMLPADRERLINGDWDIMEEGLLFQREWFRIVPLSHVELPVKAVRYWDLAATEAGPANPDPDWTVGLRLQVDRSGTFTITDIVRGRWQAHVVEQVVRQTAEADGRSVAVYLEQEPGASGKQVAEHYKRHVLAGFVGHAVRSTGDKMVRARPAAAAAGNGFVQIVEGCPNTLDFLDEVSRFPGGHDDQVDAFSGSHTALTRGSTGRVKSSVARGRLPIQTR